MGMGTGLRPFYGAEEKREEGLEERRLQFNQLIIFKGVIQIVKILK